MARVQLGLESTHKPGVTLTNYQESKVRWLHVKMEQWMNGGASNVRRDASVQQGGL